jgi:hypothetical protein
MAEVKIELGPDKIWNIYIYIYGVMYWEYGAKIHSHIFERLTIKEWEW